MGKVQNGEKAAIKRLETIGEGLEKKPSNPKVNRFETVSVFSNDKFPS